MRTSQTEAPILVTGGAGFFGSLLTNSLLEAGRRCVVLDLQRCEIRHPNLVVVQGDIRDEALIERLFAIHRFDAVQHCAAVLAHAVKMSGSSWNRTSMVRG